jgi:SRSO17 transposase
VAKGELGPDQYEVRGWAGWQRQVTLVLWLEALLTLLRAKAQPPLIRLLTPLEKREPETA